MDYKLEEIKEHLNNYIKENDQFLPVEIDLEELHHDVFNTDYYIIGTYKAEQWCGDKVFEIIRFIKWYEEDNYGEVITDFSNPENVVNSYAYILGQRAVDEYASKVCNS